MGGGFSQIRLSLAGKGIMERHDIYVRKLLKEMGFSVQRPTTKLMQAEPKRRNKWTPLHISQPLKKAGGACMSFVVLI